MLHVPHNEIRHVVFLLPLLLPVLHLLLPVSLYTATAKATPSSPLTLPAAATGSDAETSTSTSSWHRWASGPSYPNLIIGGVFAVEGQPQALARYNQETDSFTTDYEPSLYLYGASSGVVFDIVVNHTEVPGPVDLFGQSKDEVVVVGAFDTVCQSCQAQYCSVARWDGTGLSKVGEGLCPRASDAAIRIGTTAIGNKGDVFVGGSFTSRVWDGDENFVQISNVAQYVGDKQLWLPLAGGFLGCSSSHYCNASRVVALAWDGLTETLYVGGDFDMVGDRTVPPALVMWDKKGGLRGLPLPNDDDTTTTISSGKESAWLGAAPGEDPVTVSHLHFQAETGNLYVAGQFSTVGGVPCKNVAVWRRQEAKWYCLSAPIPTFHFDLIQAMAVLPAASNWTDGVDGGDAVQAGVARKGHSVARANVVTEFSAAASSSSSSPSSSSPAGHPHHSLRSLRRHGHHFSSNNDDDEDSATSAGRNMTVITTEWSWLPGHPGSDEPIYTIVPGGAAMQGAVFMGGQTSHTTTGVVVWVPGAEEGDDGVTTPLGQPGQVNGVIYCMVHADLSTPGKASGPLSGTYYSWVLFLISVCSGVILGLLAAFIFRYRGIGDAWSHKYMSLPDEGKGGIPLTSLAQGLSEVDLAVRWTRAIESRHLGTRHNLTIIDPAEIVLQRIIGEGSFGRVWRATWNSSDVAVKEFFLRQSALPTDESQRGDVIEEIVGEAGIMSYLRHPKILQLYGCSLTAQAIWIVSELCNLGSLRQLLDDKSVKLSLSRRLRLALDVAEGMLYLHTRDPPIIHRDIKSQNLFVSQQGPGELLVKIGDWGSARAIALGGKGSKTMTFGVGTACWLAPEVIRHAQGSKSTDVYAFGIVLWELATREEVHAGLSAAQIIAKVAHENLRPPVPRMCPWAHLMMDCWHDDPSKRPVFQDIVIRLSRLLTRVLQSEERRRQAAAAASMALGESQQAAQQHRHQASENTPLMHQLSASIEYDGTVTEELEQSSSLLGEQGLPLSPPSSSLGQHHDHHQTTGGAAPLSPGDRGGSADGGGRRSSYGSADSTT